MLPVSPFVSRKVAMKKIQKIGDVETEDRNHRRPDRFIRKGTDCSNLSNVIPIHEVIGSTEGNSSQRVPPFRTFLM